MVSKAAEELIQRHPLQRMESPSRGSSALLHVSIPFQVWSYYTDLGIKIIGLASFAYSFAYLVLNPNPMYDFSRPATIRLLALEANSLTIT